MKRGLLRAAKFVRDRYFGVDARTLGFFRICFGLHLIANVYDRTKRGDALAFYTNLGVLPNHYALFAPMGDKIWSLLFPFSTTSEVEIAFILIVAVYVAYTLGYKTKLAQLLAVLCLVSLDNRNLCLQNGGIVVTNVVAVWTAFLPLGARFSIDHMRRSLAERIETTPDQLNERGPMTRSAPRYARLAFFGILLNFVCIYFFNWAHKTGSTWHDGSAIHWVLWQNRIATIWAAWLRMHEPPWLSPFLTRTTLFLEASLVIWLLSPIAQKWTRRIAISSIWVLHAGIALMMTLGPFSYSMMAFSLLLIGPYDWALVHRLFAHRGPKLLVFYDPTTGWHRLARVLARLDAREALEFSSIGDEGRRSLEIPPAFVGRRFLLFDPRARGWVGGAEAVARLARELPFGALYAWLLPFLFAQPIEALLSRSSAALLVARLAPQPEAPATRFLRGVGRVFGEILAAVLFATFAVQVGTDNWAIPERLRIRQRPEFMREIVEYLRLPQGWSMFSPEAPKDDGTVVIDAVLSDGRHIDPRKQAPPDFAPGLHGPWFDDQQWCDWDLRMKWDGNRHLYPYFRDYIARLDHLDSWKQQASIRYFDVYWVNNQAPPPGSRQPFGITRQLLFSGGIKP